MTYSTLYFDKYPPHLFIRFDNGTIIRVWAYSDKNYGYTFSDDFEYSKSQKKSLQKVLTELRKYASKTEKLKFDILKSRLLALGDRGTEMRKKLTGAVRKYDLWDALENHPWARASDPAALAKEWYMTHIRKDKAHWWKNQFLQQGSLYLLDYLHPRHEDTLEFFDTNPLSFSLGQIKLKSGEIHNIGLSMHYFPPKVRRMVICEIFKRYQNIYKKHMFDEKQTTPVMVHWADIVKPLERYGVGFAIKQYVPSLMKNMIRFRYSEWENAIFIASRKLSGITQQKLEQKWREFLKSRQGIHAVKKLGLTENWLNN